jgi:uncharacterized protein (TIGR00369 family)
VKASFDAQAAMRLLGAELVAVEPGRCRIGLAVRPELGQQDGFVHAGIVTTIADSAAGYAAFTVMTGDARVLTVELKINLLAPAKGERLLATGHVERAGRTLTVVRAEVEAFTNGTATTVAVMQGTMIAVRPGSS